MTTVTVEHPNKELQRFINARLRREVLREMNGVEPVQYYRGTPRKKEPEE